MSQIMLSFWFDFVRALTWSCLYFYFRQNYTRPLA